MTLQGENRRLVVMGLEALRQPQRLGLRALIHACGCDEQEITAGTIGYILAPRVNAAGRMEQAELAVRLFLTQDPAGGRPAGRNALPPEPRAADHRIRNLQ